MYLLRFISCVILTSPALAYTEELVIKDLGNGYSAFIFNFVTKTNITNHDGVFSLFPKRMFDIYHEYLVDELHLSLVRGFWDTAKFGPSFTHSVATGVEIWAWFNRHTVDVSSNWMNLLQDISGKMCASVTSSVRYHDSPRWSYRPEGLNSVSDQLNSSAYLRVTKLPTETLCTENLTPWLKLTPCQGLSGLAQLIQPVMLYKANFLSVSIDLLRGLDKDSSFPSLVFQQRLTLVFDRRLYGGSPASTYSLEGYLGSGERRKCLAAKKSSIFVLEGPDPVKVFGKSENGKSPLLFQTAYEAATKNLIIEKPKGTRKASFVTPLTVEKYYAGSGDLEGRIRTAIRSHSNSSISLVYYDIVPWMMVFYSSSLRCSVLVDGVEVAVRPRREHVRPGKRRERPASIELFLDVPPQATLVVEYRVHNFLMRWNEYPPDANHGLYVPSASVSYYVPEADAARMVGASFPPRLPVNVFTYGDYLESWWSGEERRERVFTRQYSANVLVKMPVPDFSMPFNVLCFVCSVVAILFSAVQKAVVMRFIVLPVEDTKRLTWRERILQKLKLA